MNTLEFRQSLRKSDFLGACDGKRQDIDSLKQALWKTSIIISGISWKEETSSSKLHAHSSLIGKEVIFDDFKTRRRAKVLDILGNGNILLEIGEEEENTPREITLKEIYRGEHA